MIDRSRNSLLTIAIVLIVCVFLGNGTYEQCLMTLRNTVVYEGTLDTLLNCATEPNVTEWIVTPTSAAFRSYPITNFDDDVNPSLTEFYAFNQTGLLIRNATTNGTSDSLSTAGVYTVGFATDEFKNSTNKTAAKLLVIRSGPICSCNESTSDAVNISCTIVYADHPSSPINAVMNCTANGQLYNATTPMRTSVPSTPFQYVYSSTPFLIVNMTTPTTYDCLVTFGAPALGPSSFVAKNAPDFSANRQVSCGPTTTASTGTTIQAGATSEPLSPVVQSSAATSTLQQTTLTSLPLTTTPLTTVSVTTQQILAEKEIVLSLGVLLSVVLGCIFLTSAVCCCWYCLFFPGCCQRGFRRQPIYVPEANEISIANDFGFWGRRYVSRCTGGSFRHNQLNYQSKWSI